MIMKRRDFVKLSTLSAGFALGKVPVWAQNLPSMPELEDRILVIIQMFGGNDGLNTVIPADNDLYYSKFRKSLNIPKNKTIKLGNSNAYLHPSLNSGPGNGLSGLFKEGKVAVLQGVGYPNPNLSHFRSTDIWLSGKVPSADSERLESGWIGSYLSSKGIAGTGEHPDCLNIGSNSSLIFRHNAENFGLSVSDPVQFYESGKDLLTGDSFVDGSSKYASEFNYLLDLSIKSNKYSKVVKDAFDKGKNTQDYSNDGLVSELKLVARLISGGLKTKVYLLNINGFDTHAAQGTTDGKHAALLKSVNDSIAWFMADLKAQNLSKNVVGMTISEFGRRPNENESGGTDHGAAGAMFVFGDEVKGGLYGNNFDFSKLDSNGDFIHQFDYRAVYDEILFKWMGGSDTAIKSVLQKRYSHIQGGILNDYLATGSPLANDVPTNNTVFPNPTTDGFITLNLNLPQPDNITLFQTTLSGQRLSVFQNIPLPTGTHSLPVQLKNGRGNYILEVLGGNIRESFKVIWI